jgi:hypothetical protein
MMILPWSGGRLVLLPTAHTCQTNDADKPLHR